MFHKVLILTNTNWTRTKKKPFCCEHYHQCVQQTVIYTCKCVHQNTHKRETLCEFCLKSFAQKVYHQNSHKKELFQCEYNCHLICQVLIFLNRNSYLIKRAHQNRIRNRESLSARSKLFDCMESHRNSWKIMTFWFYSESIKTLHLQNACNVLHCESLLTLWGFWSHYILCISEVTSPPPTAVKSLTCDCS